MTKTLSAAVDAYAHSADKPIARPEAIRRILADWLAAHGFLKRGEVDHPEPKGPASEVVKAMDAAIGEHKRRNGTSSEKKRR